MAAEVLDVTSMLPNRYEPKRQNRWILLIEGIDAFILKKAGRPKMQTNAIEIPWMNATRYLAGKTKFQPVSLTLGDPIAPSGAQQVMEWIRLHYESVSGRAGYADFYKRNMQLKLTDPIGTVVELWQSTGTLITNVDFGELDYEQDGPADITIETQSDNWVLQF